MVVVKNWVITKQAKKNTNWLAKGELWEIVYLKMAYVNLLSPERKKYENQKCSLLK